MPLSEGFLEKIRRVFGHIDTVVETPYYVYDHKGIVDTAMYFKSIQHYLPGYRNFFAVKALPNVHVMRLLFEQGMGFDCSSVPEIQLAKSVGASGADIFFTSNNTSAKELHFALEEKVNINLDDLSILKKFSSFPDFLCFRLSPLEVSNDLEDPFMMGGGFSKFGMTEDQLCEAYSYAKQKGVREFGLHGMFNSNERDVARLLYNATALFECLVRVERICDINIGLLNIGGGLGIKYHWDEAVANTDAFIHGLADLVKHYQKVVRHSVRIVTEFGRYVTGPHGAIVTSVVNVLSKKTNAVGVDASLCTILRPALYGHPHRITMLADKTLAMNENKYVVVGSLCESMDRLGEVCTTAPIVEGSKMIIHDAGAHCHSMSFSYNGRLRPAEVLLLDNDNYVVIREAEKAEMYYANFTSHAMGVL